MALYVQEFNLNCRFELLCSYFDVKPKPNEEKVSPKDFFSMWTSFCDDFKNLWKREQQRVIKERLVDVYFLTKYIKS